MTPKRTISKCPCNFCATMRPVAERMMLAYNRRHNFKWLGGHDWEYTGFRRLPYIMTAGTR